MLLKVIQSVLFITLTTFSSVGKSQSVCAGGWQYKQLVSCQNPDAGCNKQEPVYNSCAAQVNDAGLGCGPESYKSCPSKSCPDSKPAQGYTLVQKNWPTCKPGDKEIKRDTVSAGLLNRVFCETPEYLGSCSDSACGVAEWKSCRHSSCGVESQSCVEYKSSYSEKYCGTPTNQLTAANAAKPNSVETDGRVANDFYEIGSSCLTCDDVPTQDTANIQKRFECLAKGIDLAEKGTAGYSFVATYNILRKLQTLGSTYSSVLTPDQNQKLLEILSRYPTE